MAAFFLVFLWLSVLFSLRQPPKLKGLVDGSLVFGLPLLTYGLLIRIFNHENSEVILTICALVLAAVYFISAYFLKRAYKSELKLLSESFFLLGIVFLTIAVPVGLSESWIIVSWSIEGSGLIWLGLRQGALITRVIGGGLQLVSVSYALIIYIANLSEKLLAAEPIAGLDENFIVFAVSSSSLILSYVMYNFVKRESSKLVYCNPPIFNNS